MTGRARCLLCFAHWLGQPVLPAEGRSANESDCSSGIVSGNGAVRLAGRASRRRDSAGGGRFWLVSLRWRWGSFLVAAELYVGVYQGDTSVNVVRCDRELETNLVEQTLRNWGHLLTLLPDGIGEDGLCTALAECDLLLVCYTPITERVLASAPRLRGIVKYGVGIDAIDIPAAHSAGDRRGECANVCGGNGRGRSLGDVDRAGEEAADVAAGDAVRRMGLADGAVVGGGHRGQDGGHRGMRPDRGDDGTHRWRWLPCPRGGLRSWQEADEMRSIGVEPYDDLREMLAICDFVSLHVALSDATRHLIGAAELAAMRPSAFLINSARARWWTKRHC